MLKPGAESEVGANLSCGFAHVIQSRKVRAWVVLITLAILMTNCRPFLTASQITETD